MIGESALARERVRTAHLDAAKMTVAGSMIHYGACRQAVLAMQAGTRWVHLSRVQQRYHPEIARMSGAGLEGRMVALGMVDAYGDAEGQPDDEKWSESDPM